MMVVYTQHKTLAKQLAVQTPRASLTIGTSRGASLPRLARCGREAGGRTPLHPFLRQFSDFLFGSSWREPQMLQVHRGAPGINPWPKGLGIQFAGGPLGAVVLPPKGEGAGEVQDLPFAFVASPAICHRYWGYLPDASGCKFLLVM